MADKALKVAAVGYGGAHNMGRAHLNEMRRAGMIPTAVADIDTARLPVAEQDFPGIQTFSCIEDLLEKTEVDLVTIITPHNTHAPLAMQCLQAGRHVVCEKPMTVTVEECDALMAEAAKNNLLISTYHNRHWDGCVMHAVERIRAGEIGDVVRVEAHIGGYYKPGDTWRTSRTISGGILYDWGVHLLEYSLQILDAEIAEVSGFAKNGFWASQSSFGEDTNEDEGFLTVRFKNHTWLTMSISAIDMNAKESDRGILEITGTQGTYILWGDRWRIKTRNNEETVVREGRNPASMSYKFYENIAAYLAGKDALVITPEWARRPVQILDLAVQSAKLGHSLLAKYV